MFIYRVVVVHRQAHYYLSRVNIAGERVLTSKNLSDIMSLAVTGKRLRKTSRNSCNQ